MTYSKSTATISGPKATPSASVYRRNSKSGRKLHFIRNLSFSLFASLSICLTRLSLFHFPRPVLKHSVRRSVRRHVSIIRRHVSIKRPLCKIMTLYLSDAHFTKRNIQARGAQIADAMSPPPPEYRQPNFDWWGLIFVGLRYGTRLMSPSRCLNIWGVR